MREEERSVEQAGYCALLGAAFSAPFSLPAGRAFLALALILLLIEPIRARRFPALPPVVWLGLAWIVVACVVTVNGVHPELGVPKLRKLIWFCGIPVTAALVSSPRRLRGMVAALTAGGLVLAVDILVGNPLVAMKAWRGGRFDSFWLALVDAGSMTDGQRLAVCMVAALAMILLRRAEGLRIAWPVTALVLQTAAMVFNFKRGSWITVLFVVAIFVAVRVKWRVLLVLGAVVAAALLVPAVRDRVAHVRDEFDAGRGGRALMWKEIAPALIKAHPWGIGYRSLTNDMMREIAPRVEPGRDHLHSNVVQILVATGWLGLLLYLAWMGRALWDAGRFCLLAREVPEGEYTLALAVGLMLLALLANGLVEYNFGDGELVLLYGFIIGAAAAGAARCRPGMAASLRFRGRA